MVCWYFSLVGKMSRESTGQCHRYGGARGGRAPLNGCLCLPILVYSNTVFGTSRNDKTTDNDSKRINYVKHSSPLSFILCEIAGNQLLYINLTQKPVLFSRLYGCVGKTRCKPAKSLPVLR